MGVEPYARPPALRPPDEPPAPGAVGPASEPGSSASSAPDVGRSPQKKWVDDWARFRIATEAYLGQLREQLNWAQHQAELRALHEQHQAQLQAADEQHQAQLQAAEERGRAQAQREAAAAALAAPAPKCWCWPWR